MQNAASIVIDSRHASTRRLWHSHHMDGKDAWRDNVFVERLWRSVKYEEVARRNAAP